MNDPSQSGPTFPFIAGMMNYLGGVSAGESYFTKLKANGLVIHPTNGPTLQALTSGQINLALVQSSAGDRRRARRQEHRHRVPEPGHAAAERDRHRRQGTRGRTGRGEAVHRVRPVAGGPEGHADRRPDRRLALLPGHSRASARCPRCRRWPAPKRSRSTRTPGARRRAPSTPGLTATSSGDRRCPRGASPPDPAGARVAGRQPRGRGLAGLSGPWPGWACRCSGCC